MSTSPFDIGCNERRLNGPQTTGRTYRNLSEPIYQIREERNVEAVMRDGTRLLVDVLCPDAGGVFPVLISASCYPRQLQNTGLPLGFVESGASDFWVSRGYVHILANVRGTGGSEGLYSLMDSQERRDLHDLVEWAAAQPYCDGKVGMLGISYFAMTQLQAAVEQPPHLRAILPIATSVDLYEVAYHGGLLNAQFIRSWLSGVGWLASKSDDVFRNWLIRLTESVLKSDFVHRRFEHLNGEALLPIMEMASSGHAVPKPWHDLYLSTTVEHQLRDRFWDERDLTPLLRQIQVPVYLGCDWSNIPLHLQSTFVAWRELNGRVPVRMGVLGPNGLTWPWESMHVEALAWFDQWLKGRDTGILEGPPIRYFLPGAEEWRTADTWPPAEVTWRELALCADGQLLEQEGVPGERAYLYIPRSLDRWPQPGPQVLPVSLSWETPFLPAQLEVAGPLEVVLDAKIAATDTAWIVRLEDVAPDGNAALVTAGWLRASLRAIDEESSRRGWPVLPCRKPQVIMPGELVRYRIPLVGNARRFAAGHRIRLKLASAEGGDLPALMNLWHAPIAQPTRNVVCSSSRLLLPVLS